MHVLCIGMGSMGDIFVTSVWTILYQVENFSDSAIQNIMKRIRLEAFSTIKQLHWAYKIINIFTDNC